VDASLIQKIAVWALPVLAGVILHEVSHGWVAYRLGDPTAKEAGRLTLNPIPHIDPLGTIIIPLLLLLSNAPILFGYARPVPVHFGRLRHPKRDMIFVAAAGPITNLILAALSAVLLHATFDPSLVDPAAPSIATQGFLAQVALTSLFMNVGLAVFNLLPVPPLDGGRVATGLLPMSLAVPFAKLERYGMLIVVLLLYTNVAFTIMAPIRRFLLGIFLGDL
jgi:Zn-dependent protease